MPVPWPDYEIEATCNCFSVFRICEAKFGVELLVGN
jgi:hypothetical protein